MFSRDHINVFVPEAQALGTIAVIRSLARAGYRVHAASSDPSALGLQSNFVTTATVCPSYDDGAYLHWLDATLKQHAIDAIVPSEGFLHAIRPAFEKLKHLMPIPEVEEDTYRSFSKVHVMEALLSPDTDLEWQDHLPPSLIIREDEALPHEDEITALGLPLYLKGDMEHAIDHSDAYIARFETVSEALGAIETQRGRFEALLLQGHVGGVKAAASFVLDSRSGEVIAESGVLARRTTPHTGGMMSLRTSWHHPKMAQMAKAWLDHLGWRGAAMVECKWDPETDQFWLIEINARFWGYLHLDLFSGVDTPRLQMDRFVGFPVEEAKPSQTLGVSCRHTLPGDSSWLISLLKDPAVPALHKLGAVCRFGLDFFNPSQRSDLLFPGDEKLYWLQLRDFVRLIVGKRFSRANLHKIDAQREANNAQSV